MKRKEQEIIREQEEQAARMRAEDDMRRAQQE
jgi:hypothetical protein